ncbi:MAG: chaperonin GroEL [Caldilineaceae bacterium]
MGHPRLSWSPDARQALCRGFNLLSNLLEVTLGPRGRLVAVAGANPRKAPELLDDGAAVARRFLGLPNRFESMGALLARHIAWRVEESVGDGSTTAVVIACQLLNEAHRYGAAGHNVMSLRRGIERALPLLLNELTQQALPLEQPAQIAALGRTITQSAQLGDYIEEIFDTVGAFGAIQVRTNYQRTHDRRYIQGAFWNQGWVSSSFTTEAGKAVLEQPYILFTNQPLSRADHLLPIMNEIRRAGQGGLVVLAPAITGDALNLLVTNKVRQRLPTLAVKAPGLGAEKIEILEDLAVLCGGRLLHTERGDNVEDAHLADLGRAEEVQAIRSGFTIVGGKGRPAAIRQRYQDLRRQIPDAPRGRARDRLGERAGKLLGGVALLEIGGATAVERDYTKERAKEAVNVVRLGLQEGIVPGGGVAFLRCLPALAKLHLPEEEAPALNILRNALMAPAQAILRNAGYAPAPILAHLLESSNGLGFDVMQGQMVDVMAANIVDPVIVLKEALHIGVSGALMGLTTETLVHRPRHNRAEEVDFAP